MNVNTLTHAGLSDLYERILSMLRAEDTAMALGMLAGSLNALRLDGMNWPTSRATLRAHLLHRWLLLDPYTEHAFRKPRGYPGDAELIDLIYDREAPIGTSSAGIQLFEVTTNFPVARAVRRRRELAAAELERSFGSQRVCVLACGHLREADGLAGQDLRSVTAVDQDRQSLARVAAVHGDRINLADENVFKFLRLASIAGEKFDLIYSLGLTDYLDERSVSFLIALAKKCLAPEGRILIANFVPGHPACGWMDGCMDWHLICREGADLAAHATRLELEPSTFLDETATIAYCEMRCPR